MVGHQRQADRRVGSWQLPLAADDGLLAKQCSRDVTVALRMGTVFRAVAAEIEYLVAEGRGYKAHDTGLASCVG